MSTPTTWGIMHSPRSGEYYWAASSSGSAFIGSEHAMRQRAKVLSRAYGEPGVVFTATPYVAGQYVIRSFGTSSELAALRAQKHAIGPAPKSTWGTPGSQAEAYKRLIMANRTRKTLTGKDELTDDEIHAVVERELGVGKAGPKSYVQWYRNWLTKHGHKPPPKF